MSDIDVVEYLASKGYEGKPTTNGQEVSYPCFFGCAEDRHSRKRKLYVNQSTGMYHCFVCEAYGGSTLLQRHFGDEPARTEAVVGRRSSVLEAVTRAGEHMLAASDDAMLYLIGKNRWLPADVIVERRFGYVGNRSLIGTLPVGEFTKTDIESAGIVWATGPYVGRDFYRDSILIPYVQDGRIVQVRGKSLRDGSYYTGPGDRSYLYNADALANVEEVIIVEGEFDTAMLANLLAKSPDLKVRDIAVVGLAGVHSLPADLDTLLENVKRIYIGTDPDEAGRKAADRLVERYGARAHKLDWPEKLLRDAQADGYKLRDIDWTLWIGRYGATWADVLVMLRQSSRLTSMAEAGSRFRNRPNTGIKLGFAELDAWIHPGLLPGQVMVPLAKTGCIYGDAEMAINRAGKGFTIKLKDLVHRFNGGAPRSGRSWDLTIPTLVQREEDGVVRLGRIANAWASGVKQTYTVTTEPGRTIRATDEHPFLTERGWLRLDQLRVGDDVHVRGERTRNGQKKVYYARRTVPYHPFAGRKGVQAGGHSVAYHRLVAEAQLNHVDVDFFVKVHTREEWVDYREGLRYLHPDTWAVHHIDHDPSNNDPGNLKILTHVEHAALHAAEGTTRNVQVPIATEKVLSVEPYGMEETYDIEVIDDPHNFLANGFVVHNTGKTIWSCNVAYNLRHRRVMYISLEQTCEEIYMRLARIHRFYRPAATNEEIESYLGDLRICDQNRLTPTDFAQLVEEYADSVGAPPELVILDYLGYYARGMKGGSPYEKTSNAVMQLKEEAKSHRLSIIAPHQVNRVAEKGKPLDASDSRDSGVVEETADFMLGIFRPSDALTTEHSMPDGRLRQSLLKSRHGNADNTCSLQMGLLSLVIVDAVNPLARQAAEEAYLRHRGYSYEEYLAERAPAQLSMSA